MTNQLDAWIEELCAALGVDPALVDRDLILDVARDAAHNIARPAAPVTTFIIGLAAGQNGTTVESASNAARAAQRLALAHAPEV
jgi:hypothetical protein